MATKRAARSFTYGPNSPLTDDDIKALTKQFGNDFRNFTDEQWRELATRMLRGLKAPGKSKVATRKLGNRMLDFIRQQECEFDLLLPPRPTGPSRVFRMFAAAANYYWKNMANLTQARESRRRLAQLIEDLRREREILSKLAPDYVEGLSGMTKIIDGLDERWRNLRYEANSSFHRRRFIRNVLCIWDIRIGEIGSSRNKVSGKLSGPLIDYLMFACDLVMGESAPEAETLRADIRDFKRTESKMWMGH